jgi:acetyl-CoA carboxylase carboxyltransferase component
MVGRETEQAAIIHHGALVFSTIANLSVPHACVVVRKAYTAGLYAMGGPGFEPERFMAFPQAHITIYGSKAIRLLAQESHMCEDEQAQMVDQVNENCSVWRYRDAGDLDAVIAPEELRGEIVRFLKNARAQPPGRKEPRRILCL